MSFGIREKVALLVMLATAASCYLVAKVLTHRATANLREHELVDLGDEASLRGWVMIDRIEGLKDDLIKIAYNSNFANDVTSDKTEEELFKIARGLCRRYWKNHLRLDVVTIRDGIPETKVISSKAIVDEKDMWLPPLEQLARPGLNVSSIQRMRVVHTNIPGHDEFPRWEPVIWATANLDREGGQSTDTSRYVRIMMTLYDEPSPRHLFTLENSDGAQLVRHDESDSLERGNDQVFLKLSKTEELQSALEERREERKNPTENEEEPKVERLVRNENVPLNSPYFFREGTPGQALTDVLDEMEDPEVLEILERIQIEAAPYGRVGGMQGGVREVRILAHSREELETIQQLVTDALEKEFSIEHTHINWRAVVECDEIHSWAVKIVSGSVDHWEEYLIHYAVLDDELASSIEYEMKAVQNVALAVAAMFGIFGFLIAMHFIRPLRQMTLTAQKITDSHGKGLYKKVGALARNLEIKRRDEVGDIARASKRLFEELIASQEELEDRVHERTHELRRANSSLEEANEKLMSLSHEKDAFVAKISHDLRQPLNAIFLQVEALKLSELDDAQKKDVQRIHDHAARELNLVNDILEYQKIIMGAETLNKDTIDIQSLVDDLVEAHTASLDQKPVELKETCDKDIGSLVADDRRLRQVLGNLVGNACKFTKEGSVTIEARAREIGEVPWVEFTVADTGRGMSPEEQSKAFTPFVSNKKDNAGGSGLGLSICKELVSQMGGRIGFISELGEGTQFSVFLPRIPDSEHYEKREIPESEAEFLIKPSMNGDRLLPGSDGGTILVIDDDERVRNMLSRILGAEGYDVITAPDGPSGIALAKREQPDAITLDVVMPGGKDGWDVLHTLKESPETERIPVIMVSVMAESENGFALGVEDYLVKPIDIDRLSRVIARVTSHAPQRNILLVDDDVDSLQALQRLMEQAGLQTVIAENGARALDVLQKTRPAAIVLDLMMPEMDGFEFLQRLQTDSSLSSIPVIVMTGKEPSEEEFEFLRERVATVLRKGESSPSELLRLIQKRVRPAVELRA